MNTSAFYTNHALFESHFRYVYGLSNDEVITDDAILDYVADFYFSEWYNIFEDFTIRSQCNWCIADLTKRPEAIDAAIAALPGGHCFARLDTCSSKPDKPFHTANEILSHLISSTRTQFIVHAEPQHRLIIREWISDIDVRFCEIRCYITDGVFRGISGGNPATMHRFLRDITTLVTKIVQDADYPDCVIDLLLPRRCTDSIQLVEINTPVWLFATSGVFDITLPEDIAILCGPLSALVDIIQLPVWRGSHI